VSVLYIGDVLDGSLSAGGHTPAAVSTETDADAELAAAIEQLKMENDELAKRLESVKVATMEQVGHQSHARRASPETTLYRRSNQKGTLHLGTRAR
jgi:hypothetical protein